MFNIKQFTLFIIGLLLSASLFAQENSGAKQYPYMGEINGVIRYADTIYSKMTMNITNKIELLESERFLIEGLSKPSNESYNCNQLNRTVDIFNRYIDIINKRMSMLIDCQKTKISIQKDKYKSIYEYSCMTLFFQKIGINEQALIYAIDSSDLSFKLLDDTKYTNDNLFKYSPGKPDKERANEYAAHMNRIFNQLAQIFQIKKTGYYDFIDELNKRLNAIHENRYAIFQWYRDWYCNKQHISNNFQLVFFINDVSSLDSNTPYPQGSVFLINDLYKRDNVSARERHQFFIENHESQANIQQSFVAQKVYDFMDDEWDVRFTYYEKFSMQNDSDHRPWLVIGSFLQFVSVNRYNCKDLLEIFPSQPGDFGFDWNCLQDDKLYPEKFNSFLEKWINDKFAYDSKLDSGLTEAEKTEALLSILKEQLNIVKPRLRYIKNHTTTPGVAEFIRHIINED